jgi:hypothetical protein
MPREGQLLAVERRIKHTSCWPNAAGFSMQLKTGHLRNRYVRHVLSSWFRRQRLKGP